MVALRIDSLGSFMSGLFSGNTFDSFLLMEGTLRTAVTWHLEGRLNREFFGKEEAGDAAMQIGRSTAVAGKPAAEPGRPSSAEHPSASEEGEHVPWSEIRPLLRELVRGKRTPLSFRFVLCLKPRYMEAMLRKEQDGELLECVGAFVLTILYGADDAQIRTGISMKSFTMNKSADQLWDKAVKRFLQSKDVRFEELS